MKKDSHLATPASVRAIWLSFSSTVKSPVSTFVSSSLYPLVKVLTKLSALLYMSVDLSPLPEMISGVLASSMRMESTSSMMA